MKILYFLIPMAVSLFLMFPIKWVAIKLGLYAKSNERTIHTGKIPRIGGVAIFIGFLVGVFMYSSSSEFIKGLVLGASIVFAEGLIDDIFDVKPWVKIVAQVAAAFCLFYVGHVQVPTIRFPLFFITSKFLINVISLFWVIGITNAINLIDGLDGLAGGFSVIVLMTSGILSRMIFQTDTYYLCIIVAGATMGFLFHNFHPASIFMGDCGSQLLGFLISAIALAGLKSATFIVFMVPIILLFLPIMDTFSAIIRRALKGESFATADKSHFHHQLMKNLGLGQTGAVLVIYVITFLFGFTAYMYVTNREIGLLLLVFMIVIFELFIEYTGMISPKYRPILNVLDRLLKRNQ
ncbi:MAG: undecaprenyl/decaprenyl-phosphate alpha-N-acetylglucosaminyl 1-phosphate transferase [Erysipelotrichaceae bacterium]|nr:undecaprenyl/decaprenyl-phosphate alpha-N-acetylglucosaminyl 1-phosphate transferase [Erysipelotrichaceae bacterium]